MAKYTINRWLHDEKPDKTHWGLQCKEKVTIPGQAYSVKEMVDRIKKGRPTVIT